ncbi:MAG: ABC transporter ATP-binding protein [Steroidobacteraceae bacterium]
MSAAAGAALISARHLAKTYQLGEQAVHALRDVSFDVMPGEFVAIMGPSGSGKSTLMNLIGALDTPSSGELTIDGAPISGLGAEGLAELRNRTIGFVFQQFNLLRRTSALENVKLPLLYSRHRPADMAAAARTALEQVGLGSRLDHQPSQLSGGQQQRVAIARALVNSPRLILADEPTGALDTETSREIMGLLERLNAGGLTVIIVTHEPDIAAHARRLIRLRDGRIIEDVAAADSAWLRAATHGVAAQ